MLSLNIALYSPSTANNEIMHDYDTLFQFGFTYSSITFVWDWADVCVIACLVKYPLCLQAYQMWVFMLLNGVCDKDKWYDLTFEC